MVQEPDERLLYFRKILGPVEAGRRGPRAGHSSTFFSSNKGDRGHPAGKGEINVVATYTIKHNFCEKTSSGTIRCRCLFFHRLSITQTVQGLEMPHRVSARLFAALVF